MRLSIPRGHRQVVHLCLPLTERCRLRSILLFVVLFSLAVLPKELLAQSPEPLPAVPHSTVPPLPTTDPAADVQSADGESGDATSEATGIFSVLYIDNFEAHEFDHAYLLIQDDNTMITLDIDQSLLEQQGGASRFEGRRVIATFTPSALEDEEGGAQRVVGLSLAPGAEAEEVVAPSEVGQTRVLRYVNLLCHFPDLESSPIAPEMFSAWHMGGDWTDSGGPVNSMRHYFYTVSYGNLRIEFTTVSEWRAMSITYAEAEGKFHWMVPDNCPRAFRDIVDFGQYDGVQMITDGWWPRSYGSASYSLGAGGRKPMTVINVMGYFAETGYYHDVFAHEIGHSLGEPHANNSDSDEWPYDNKWDIMSGSPCSDPKHLGGGLFCLANDFAANHKLNQGWIAPQRIRTIDGGGDVTLNLDWLPLGGVSSNYAVAVIPISDDHYFTIESRTNEPPATYDLSMPGTAVIIHDVQERRDEPAWQVGADSDAASESGGGVWLSGETYTNNGLGFAVEILAGTATGYRVRVRPTAAAPTPPIALKTTMTANTSKPGRILINVRFSNTGGFGATGNHFTFEPNNANLLSVEGTTCELSDDGTTHICTLGEIPPNGHVEATLTLIPTVSGQSVAEATVVTEGIEPNKEDNFGQVTYEAIALPDLSVSVRDDAYTTGAYQFPPGAPIRFSQEPEFYVGNRGATAISFTVQITLSEGIYLSSQPLAGPCEPEDPRAGRSRSITCIVPALDGGDELYVKPSLHIDAPENTDLVTSGHYTATVQVTSNTTEFTLDDNSARTTICLGICVPEDSSALPVFLPSVRRTDDVAVCACHADLYDCREFEWREIALECFFYCTAKVGFDVHKLDTNGDGDACWNGDRWGPG